MDRKRKGKSYYDRKGLANLTTPMPSFPMVLSALLAFGTAAAAPSRKSVNEMMAPSDYYWPESEMECFRQELLNDMQFWGTTTVEHLDAPDKCLEWFRESRPRNPTTAAPPVTGLWPHCRSDCYRRAALFKFSVFFHKYVDHYPKEATFAEMCEEAVSRSAPDQHFHYEDPDEWCSPLLFGEWVGVVCGIIFGPVALCFVVAVCMGCISACKEDDSAPAQAPTAAADGGRGGAVDVGGAAAAVPLVEAEPDAGDNSKYPASGQSREDLPPSYSEAVM